MIIVTSCDNTHDESGVMGNRPEERKRLVKAALEEAGFKSVIVSNPEPNLDLAQCVHSKELLSFLKTAWSEWEHLWKSTVPSRRGYLVPYGVTQQNSDEVPGLVPCYVAPRDGLQRESKTVIGAIAMFGLDRETPITSLTYSQLCLDMAIVRRCIDHVCSNENAVVYAQVTHPGHHSGSGFFGGFCFLNNAAIVARELNTRLNKKIAVLDVDYHAGNGTESIFYEDPNVLVISLHADPDLEYPFNSCYPDQTGAGDGLGTTLNLVMPVHTTWPEYKRQLEVAISRIADFGAGALVVSLGLDTLSGDPVAFPTATFDLFAEDFGEMGAIILKDTRLEHLPKVFLQEGGYKLEEVTKGVLNFFTMKTKV